MASGKVIADADYGLVAAFNNVAIVGTVLILLGFLKIFGLSRTAIPVNAGLLLAVVAAATRDTAHLSFKGVGSSTTTGN